jgi:predicted aspartyl protease
MRIDGKWLTCDDGIVRPVMLAEVRAHNGSWVECRMLLDVGADRTVLSCDVFRELGINSATATQSLEGVGGRAESVIVATQIRVQRENGSTILLNGPFAAFTDPAALDMSVLGRDVTNHFAVIVDRPQDVVCLIGGNHRYVIVDK